MSKLNIRQNSRVLRLGLTLAFGLALLIGLLLAMGTAHLPDVVLAQGPTIRYVDGATGNDSSNDCTTSNTPCATIQHAVDEADPGDEIRVAAGTYTGVQGRPVPAGYPSPPDSGIVIQVVYISKTLTVRGGYTTTDWSIPYPLTRPTTLDAQQQGRVLFISGETSPTIEGLQVTGGNAYWLGGGMDKLPVGGGVYVFNATAILSNCWLFDNTAYNGGGLYLYDSAATLNGNTVFSNTAYGGGGLCLQDSDATLTSNTITSNTAYYGGGGLGLWYSDATLISNTITSNTAGYGGGGLDLWYSDATLSGNTVSFNTANDGGGLDLHDSAATLNGNTVTVNTANYSGGGLWLWGSAAILSDNIITANTAGYDGGGLYLWGSPATLNGNTVSSNIANDGGGLELQYSDATLTNNVIADNRTETAGSGLYASHSSPRLLHTTIARNSGGDGSGVYITGTASAVALTNTILVSHTVGITVSTDNTAILNGVLWYSNTINHDGEGTITVTHEYTGNPAFATDGYHLTAFSEAIDKDVEDAGVKDDIDGEPRPLDGDFDGLAIPDIGADEFYKPGLIFLPLILKISDR
jgi:parallel beta-helix repeat protein